MLPTKLVLLLVLLTTMNEERSPSMLPRFTVDRMIGGGGRKATRTAHCSCRLPVVVVCGFRL